MKLSGRMKGCPKYSLFKDDSLPVIINRIMRNRISVLGLFILLLTSCQVSRMNKVMNGRYKNQVTEIPKQKNNEISIVSTNVESILQNPIALIQ